MLGMSFVAEKRQGVHERSVIRYLPLFAVEGDMHDRTPLAECQTYVFCRYPIRAMGMATVVPRGANPWAMLNERKPAATVCSLFRQRR